MAGRDTDPPPVDDPGGTSVAVAIEDVDRTYTSGGTEVRAIERVSLEVGRGDAVAIVGPSGSGKTTLLNLVAGLDRPTRGHVSVFGRDVARMRESRLAAFRAKHVGFVFQDPHLLPGLTALENVVAARLPWEKRQILERQAQELLAAVGLTHRAHFPPARLSGGERQRVGIARALLGGRPLLLADEPTGNLDVSTTNELIQLLSDLRSKLGLTLIVATHDPAVAAMADRTVPLTGGRVDVDRDGSTPRSERREPR